ncbi:hypothetical protein CHARACLAT_008730 [Characodon lateralis]|uniref:Uncharacterized protein n=1 Tax=Characodon lateralis TaxID=208331 RepID=A0ABU7CPQ0_9TELE|nr:hypothetical protein [Characodon lateralis]
MSNNRKCCGDLFYEERALMITIFKGGCSSPPSERANAEHFEDGRHLRQSQDKILILAAGEARRALNKDAAKRPNGESCRDPQLKLENILTGQLLHSTIQVFMEKKSQAL